MGWARTASAARTWPRTRPPGPGSRSGLRVDWHVFRALIGRAGLALLGSPAEGGYLARALDLLARAAVSSLDGRPPGRYAWLATGDLEYEAAAQVADAAHRLAAVRLAASDPEGAMDAARSGLGLAFDDELLWRDLLRAAQAACERTWSATWSASCARGPRWMRRCPRWLVAGDRGADRRDLAALGGQPCPDPARAGPGRCAGERLT